MRIFTCIVCVLVGISLAEVVRSSSASGNTLRVRAEAPTVGRA